MLFTVRVLQVLEHTSATQRQMDKRKSFTWFQAGSKPGGQSKQVSKSKKGRAKSRVDGTDETGSEQVDQACDKDTLERLALTRETTSQRTSANEEIKLVRDE